MTDGDSRRALAIDAAFPYLKDYGRTMSQSLTYELGILVSCMRLRTITSHSQLMQRILSVRPKTQADADVLDFVVQHGSPMVNPSRT